LASDLDDVLSEHNIQCVACPSGKAMGNDNDIRVFDIQHIKGLEFEAVFFVDIDELAARNPDLFDKYLYVGATRAATYLGITCRDDLPQKLAPLSEQFAESFRADCQS
jgi:DNA helicase IV